MKEAFFGVLLVVLGDETLGMIHDPCLSLWDTFPIRQDIAVSASGLARIQPSHVLGGHPGFPRTPFLNEWLRSLFASPMKGLRISCAHRCALAIKLTYYIKLYNYSR